MRSTRGNESVNPSLAILRGLAPDGGLYVPETFPEFTLETITALAELPYEARALQILSKFLPDFTEDELKEAIHGAYGTGFDDARIAPLVKLDDATFSLELWHGPTLAFKDMALQLLPYLLTLSARKNGENREIFILVATSGDTGKAALEGFLDVPGTRCAVFYPKDGVSRAQRLQMVTTGGRNTHVIAVDGNFDDAQSGVKKIFGSQSFAETMNDQGRVLSSANSINFGRLVPQIVYYFSAYADLIRTEQIQPGEEVNFCVPTGNFGDILAADYARRAGLPVGRLICASNTNNVLTDFIQTGVYDISDRPFYKTVAPSMDILISSNLERLIFTLAGNDPGRTADLMHKLATERRYEIDELMLNRLQAVYACGYADEVALKAEIWKRWHDQHYLMDTHTAVASAVLREYVDRTGDTRKNVIVSTASPYKFGPAVLSGIGGLEVESMDDFECCVKLSALTGTKEPDVIKNLPGLPVRHDTVCAKDKMAETLIEILKK
ncbi:MAG: threonine synthase [Clostridia bacterium]|nr:threonine synthase [Clostridia bacterium]